MSYGRAGKSRAGHGAGGKRALGAALGAAVVLFSLMGFTLPQTAGSDTASQASATSASATSEPVRVPVPFAAGERAQYRVSYNVVGRVGTATLGLPELTTVRGHPTFRSVFTLDARFLFARVDDRYESWIDRTGIYSHRFTQEIRQLRYRRERLREFFPAQRRWTGRTNDREESGRLPTAEPLDDVSFLYFIRTIELEVGREYTFNRYWNDEGNPVRIRVLREERVTVPAGTFDTVVLRPIIETSGLFADGGEAEVWIAVNGARPVVKLRAGLSIGTLNLELEEFHAGARRSADQP